jgi:hypothetical protein
VDYKVAYSNNYYPGTATATVTGINAYANASSASINYYIRRDIGDCTIEVENAAFTGEMVYPTVHVFDSETTTAELTANTDYIVVKYENNVKVGKLQIIITFEIYSKNISHN